MILGSSQADDIQMKTYNNTKEFLTILYNFPLEDRHINSLFELIEDGINVNAMNNFGYTLLFECVRANNSTLVEKIIELGADINTGSCRLDYFTTPLHKAATSGNSQIVNLLIKAGANLNAQDHEDKTALHRVTELQNTEMVELLLSLGANSELKDNQGRTALHTAAACGYADKTDIVRLLLNYKSDIDARDENGNTPLHHCKLLFPKITEFLLNKGADTSIENNDCKTALNILVDQQAIRYVVILLKVKKTLLLFINKFVEAGWERFDILLKALGEDYASVDTADKMLTQILTESTERLQEITTTISKLYPNATKMAKPSLTRQLLDAIEYPTVQACGASSSSASTSSVCVDDKQPPAIITSVRKRFERDSDSERDESEENTKRSRTRCSSLGR